jgi:hypothetical protein
LPPLLRAPFLALLFWWLVLALGYRILRWLRVPPSVLTRAEKGFLALSLGVGFIQYWPYALAAAGRLSPGNVLIGLALLALALARDMVRVARSLWASLRSVSLRHVPRPAILWGSLFCVLMGILLVRALTVTSFGDDDGYHLSAPKRWLALGTLAYLPSYTTTNASMGFEMLYAIGLSTGSPFGVKLFHYSAGLFSFLGLGLAARRFGHGIAAVNAISFLLIATPLCSLPFLFSVAYVDFGAAWMAVASILVWLVWREHPERSLLVCVALFAGFAGSFKLTAASVAIAWAPVLVIEARRQGVAWKRIVGAALGLGPIALLPVVPWMVRTWRATGNPVFPMLSSRIPTRDWNDELARVFNRFVHYYSWGISSGGHLDEGQRRLIVLATAAGIVVASGVAIARLREPAMRSLALFAGSFALISVAMAGMVFRYWLPAIMGAVLLGALWLARKYPSPRLHFWTGSALLAVALLVLARRKDGALGNTYVADLRLVTGLASSDEAYADEYAWRLWSYINANTPADARVLNAAFYQTYGAANFGNFWVDRTCYTSDSHAQTFIRLDEWRAFLRSLVTAGVTHVVLSETLYSPERFGFSFRAGLNEYAFSRRAVDELGVKLRQEGNLQVYALRLPELRAAAGL